MDRESTTGATLLFLSDDTSQAQQDQTFSRFYETEGIQQLFGNEFLWKPSDLCDTNVQVQLEKPKRPLSAYNLFFQNERKMILSKTPDRTGPGKPRRSHGKIGFAALARHIAAKWKNLDDSTRSYYESLAAQEKKAYDIKVKAYKASKAFGCKGQEQGSSVTLNAVMMDSGVEAFSSILDLPTLQDNFLPVQPISLSLVTKGTCIGDLARKLGDDTIDLLVDMFGTTRCDDVFGDLRI